MSRADALLAQLEHFEPADERERQFQERMTTLARTGSDPFGREHYVPGHFTASSFVLSKDQTNLLLIFHSKLQRWLQPGGHVDPTDVDMLAAARREVQEETGIGAMDPFHAGLFDLDIHLIPERKGAPAHEHFDLRYVFTAHDDAYTAGSDAVAARWVPLGEVQSIESDESVQRAVRKLQRVLGAR